MNRNQEEKANLTVTPSFGRNEKISAVDRLQNDELNQSDDDFEFAVAANDQLTDPSITADEIFSNGRIVPVYPVFNRDLLAEEKERIPLGSLLISDRFRSGSTSSSSSLEAEEIEGLPAGSYCVWAPRSAPQSPDRCKKSSSTGSGSSGRWRLRDLVVGRSHSDGKEKFVFLTPNPNPNPKPNPKLKGIEEEGEKKGKKNVKKGEKKVTEMDMVTAHRLFYGKNGGQAVKGGRRSYLPYRQELFGFGNGQPF